MNQKESYENMMKNKLKKSNSKIQGEIWKPIKELSHYSVSNFGRIKGKYGILTPQLTRDGYYAVNLRKSKDVKPICRVIHRLVLSTFNPIANMDKFYVNHKDLNKINNRLDNLEWVSPKENTLHFLKNTNRINYNSNACQDNLGNIFNSYAEAGRFHKISPNSVKNNVLGKTKTTRKNIIFSKVEK